MKAGATLHDELRERARKLAGYGWRTKPEIEWTPEERTAHERGATHQRTELREARKRGVRAQLTARTYEEGEEEKRSRVGEFLRPFTIVLDRANDLWRREDDPSESA